MVMIDLINDGVGGAKDRYSFDMDESRMQRINEDGRRYYSETLVDLIHRCVQRLPKDRIDVKELCERIDEAVKDLSQTVLSEEDKERFPWESAVVEKMAEIEKSI